MGDPIIGLSHLIVLLFFIGAGSFVAAIGFVWGLRWAGPIVIDHRKSE